MLPRPNYLAISALFTATSFLFATSPTSSETENSVVLILRLPKLDAPLKVIGIKFPDTHNVDPAVHLLNTSSQKTLKIWVSALIHGAQSGQTVLVNSNGPNELWSAERELDPHTEGWARDRVITSSPLLGAGKNLHSNCLLVDVLVDRVEFEDGTVWSRSWQQLLETTNFPEGSQGGPTCADATASVSEFSQLTGIEFKQSTNPKDNRSANPNLTGDVQDYTFRCTLSSRDGKTIAACPF